MTRRLFLALLGIAALPATAAAARRPPFRWVTIPAGYSGGYYCGYETRRVKVR